MKMSLSESRKSLSRTRGRIDTTTECRVYLGVRLKYNWEGVVKKKVPDEYTCRRVEGAKGIG